MPITTAQLAAYYPRAYHIAEMSALPTIERYGLLSTTAILDLLAITDEDRSSLERGIRKQSVVLRGEAADIFVLRDQKPLSLEKLSTCLQDGLEPEEWLRLLNRQIFFWLEKRRVERLLQARQYNGRRHLVMEFDTMRLVEENFDKVLLSRR